MLASDSGSQRPAWLICLFLLMLPYLSSGQAPSTEATSDKAVLQSLTAEVHQLRVTIEETASLLARMQLTITRFQMQQERVDRLNGELQGYRSELENAVTNREYVVTSLKELEAQAAPSDPGQRAQHEAQKNLLRSRLEQVTAGEQQQRAKEMELSARVRKEEADLCDLSDQLNAIAKKLAEHH